MTTRAGERLRIDDLAQRSGIASGTIRFYQREGLIPPPAREGRVAWYSDEHLDRLRRVRELQARGLPLALIRDLLERDDSGEDISPWLALDSAVFGRSPVADERALERLSELLVEAGVPREAIADGAAQVTERLGEVAATMAALGWELFEADRERLAADDEDAADEVLAKLERLRSLAQQVVGTVFAGLLDETIRERSEPFALEAVERRRPR